MDCRYLKSLDIIAYTFNQERSSIYYLIEKDLHLKILQENLFTGMIISQFTVPIKEKKIQTDNYILSYNRNLKVLILTLSCRLLIFSTSNQNLVFVSETTGKNPYYITSVAMSQNLPILFFSAVGQRNVYCIDLADCISTGAISNFTKLKFPQKVEIIDIRYFENKLVAACNDKVIRIWNTNSFTALRGMGIDVGELTAISVSKDGGKFMAGTDKGTLYVWDGKSLGANNTLILSQKISEKKIVSLCWFHCGGQFQSRRFIVLTDDGAVKLYAFSLEKNNQSYFGKALQLCSIFTIKNELPVYSSVNAHPYSNHICFSPGKLFFLVDYNPILYYPIVTSQYSHSFESLVPNNRNQIFWQRQLFFIQGLQIKRLKQGIQKKLALNSVLQYQGLKIQKMEVRPLSLMVPRKTKFLISYYLGNINRVLLIYNVNLTNKSDIIQFYKEFNCNMGMFLGQSHLTDPLLFLLNQDKQSASIMLNYQKQDRESIIQTLSSQQKNIYINNSPGELVNIKLNIKIQKVYKTPFRYGYAILYRSENILRYSKNRNQQNNILDFQLLHQPQLRIDYADILIDVVWSNGVQPIGAVVCLDKVFFINLNLGVIRTVMINGFVTQAQWQGYTLFLTTKTDFLYVNLNGDVVELFSNESQQQKYLVCILMVDRIISASRTNLRKKDKQNAVDFRTRYFNLMEPLVSGYIAYCDYNKTLFDLPNMKKIIQCFIPYYKVSREFIELLNLHRLTSFSKYFIQLNPKCYDSYVKLHTFCHEAGLQTIIQLLWKNLGKSWTKNFWKPTLFSKQKQIMLCLYHFIQSSRDRYYAEPPQYYLNKLLAYKIDTQKQGLMKFLQYYQTISQSKSKVVISTNFGEKTLIQTYRDQLNGEPVNMSIQNFQIDSISQWIGLSSNFIEAKVLSKQQEEVKDQFFEEPQGQFNDLIAYYRFDEGKGQTIEDLSDYGNNSIIQNAKDINAVWQLLDNDPLETEDKWGKKCPPQYSIKIGTCWIERSKPITYRPFTKFTIELWAKPYSANGELLSFGQNTILSITNNKINFILQSKNIEFTVQKDEQGNSDMQIPILKPQIWNHICILYQKQIGKVNLILNCIYHFEANYINEFNMPFGKLLKIGSLNFTGQITEFRLWKTKLSLDQVKDCFRSPLSIVSEKRKKLKMKFKQKKKDNTVQNPTLQFNFKASSNTITFDPEFLNKNNKSNDLTFDWGFPG